MQQWPIWEPEKHDRCGLGIWIEETTERETEREENKGEDWREQKVVEHPDCQLNASNFKWDGLKIVCRGSQKENVFKKKSHR